MVRPVRSAPRCAAESTPRARPLTTVTPRAARSAASRPAVSSATLDAARDPTIATAGASKDSSAPRYHTAGGQSPMAVSADGRRGSSQASTCMPSPAARARRARARSSSGAARSINSGSDAWRRAVRPGRARSSRRERATAWSSVIATPDARAGDARASRPRRQAAETETAEAHATLRHMVHPARCSDYRQPFFRFAMRMDGMRNRARTGAGENLNLSGENVWQAVVRGLLSRGKLLIFKALAPRARAQL